jgi:hypothetical protein
MKIKLFIYFISCLCVIFAAYYVKSIYNMYIRRIFR